jgi:PDZ domain-containing protein
MTRRSATLVAAGVAVVALLAIASLFSVPYVVYSPGPLEDTLGEEDGVPVVQIEGADTYPTSGELDLTTVGVTPADRQIHLFEALRAWADPNRAVIPREIVYPEGTTAEESREVNRQMLERSQEAAKTAALRQLGYDVPEVVVVDGLQEGVPAEGVLEVGDIVVEVDGEKVEASKDVVDAITAHEPGDEVELGLKRDGEEMTVSVETFAADDGQARVGFIAASSFEFPVEVEIGIDERIGGPSAGMIFALAIFDTLTPGDLLEDEHVAGTGEISPDGEVGPIGGIAQKIAAANEAGASLFLAPADNCDEAAGANGGDMRVVPIEDLDDAINAVTAFVDGDVEALAACAA